MAIAPTTYPTTREVARRNAFHLRTFDPLYAPLVARWPRDGRDLFWLAPKTIPPLTAAKVVGWAIPEGCPMLFHHDKSAEPMGYLELNPMPADFGHYWLGHCVIRPESRGIGQGRLMISLALELAFRKHHAIRVSLVVFPDNMPAIRCYRSVGFIDVGDQYKYFQTTGKQHRMTQMSVDRAGFLALPLPQEFHSAS